MHLPLCKKAPLLLAALVAGLIVAAGTGVARVCREVGSVAGWQSGGEWNGSQPWRVNDQCWGRCRVRRRAERVIRPTSLPSGSGTSRRLRVSPTGSSSRVEGGEETAGRGLHPPDDEPHRRGVGFTEGGIGGLGHIGGAVHVGNRRPVLLGDRQAFVLADGDGEADTHLGQTATRAWA